MLTFLNEPKLKNKTMKKAKIKIKNGYWHVNGVKIQDCDHPKKVMFDAFIKSILISEPIPEPAQPKKQAVADPILETHPNINTLVFEPA